MELHLDDLRSAFGFGVAGNFAGHLEQAGEAEQFVEVTAESAEAPKGIFPWYAPGAASFLGAFPLSHDEIALPPSETALDLQIEPEAAVWCTVSYGQGGTVTGLAPFAVAAFNDCSIRRPGATKISAKKNWGAASKGVARMGFPVTELEPTGVTATYRLASFLRRDGEVHVYGVDSPLPGYSYYGARLLDWMVDRLNHQEGAADTPLEPVGAYLAQAGHPETVLVGIGATRYTPFGEQTFLRAGDVSIVVLYDGVGITPDDVLAAVRAGREGDLSPASVLRQAVVAPAVPPALRNRPT